MGKYSICAERNDNHNEEVMSFDSISELRITLLSMLKDLEEMEQKQLYMLETESLINSVMGEDEEMIDYDSSEEDDQFHLETDDFQRCDDITCTNCIPEFNDFDESDSDSDAIASCNYIDLDSDSCDSDDELNSDSFFANLLLLERNKWKC